VWSKGPDIPDGVIESFESGLLSSEYGGDTGAFEVNQSFATQGDYGLEHTATSTTDAIARTDLTVQQGDTLRFETRNESSAVADPMFKFACQTADASPEGYGVWNNYDAGGFIIRRLDGVGSFGGTELASGALSDSATVTSTYEVDWQTDGTITYTCVDTGESISATDSTYTSGGIGFRATDDAIKFDNIRRV
jgi:hypothetical protein